MFSVDTFWYSSCSFFSWRYFTVVVTSSLLVEANKPVSYSISLAKPVFKDRWAASKLFSFDSMMSSYIFLVFCTSLSFFSSFFLPPFSPSDVSYEMSAPFAVPPPKMTYFLASACPSSF